jgi:hypothetical protein
VSDVIFQRGILLSFSQCKDGYNVEPATNQYTVWPPVIFKNNTRNQNYMKDVTKFRPNLGTEFSSVHRSTLCTRLIMGAPYKSWDIHSQCNVKLDAWESMLHAHRQQIQWPGTESVAVHIHSLSVFLAHTSDSQVWSPIISKQLQTRSG